jgi:hypothetical protein
MKQTTLHSFIPEDYIETPMNSVATDWLIKNKWVEPGGCLENRDDHFLTTAELSRVLTKIATAKPRTTSTTLAAHLTHIQQAIEYLATTLSKKNIQPLVDTMEAAIEQAMTERFIPRALQKTEARLASISESLAETMQGSLERLTTATNTLKELTKTTTANFPTTVGAGPGPRSYPAITATHNQTQPTTTTVTKQDKMDRQVRILLQDPTKESTLALPMRTLVEKANIALSGAYTTMATFLAAQVVKDDSIILIASDVSVVEQLRDPDTRQTLLDLFGGYAEIKDRAFPIAVKFVPTRGEHANTSTVFGDEVSCEIETATDSSRTTYRP